MLVDAQRVLILIAEASTAAKTLITRLRLTSLGLRGDVAPLRALMRRLLRLRCVLLVRTGLLHCKILRLKARNKRLLLNRGRRLQLARHQAMVAATHCDLLIVVLLLAELVQVSGVK